MERTLIDLASVCDEASVELALEDAFRRGLTTPARVRARIEELARHGREGPPALRRILGSPLDESPTESGLEVLFMRLVKEWGLPQPVRQHVVAYGQGETARLDFAYPELRVGIECDGYRFHGGKRAFQLDREKSNALAGLGWVVLRVTKEDVTRRQAALCRNLGRVIAEARARLVSGQIDQITEDPG